VRAIITDGTGFVGLHAVCAHINAGNIGTINPLCEAVCAEAMFGFAGKVFLEEGL